jgi:hypothetical protein
MGNQASDADARAERLDIARRLYQALIAQHPNRAITLCDGKGRAIAHHYPTPEPKHSTDIASLHRASSCRQFDQRRIVRVSFLR